MSIVAVMASTVTLRNNFFRGKEEMKMAENESKLFYAHCRDPKNENLEKAWRASKSALEAFYESAKDAWEV